MHYILAKNIIAAFVATLLVGCGPATTDTKLEAIVVPATSEMSGPELAQLHCSSCHTFPEPELLPKAVWQRNVLPQMALRSGQGNYMSELMSFPKDEIIAIISSGAYPENPTMAKEDWEKIVEYYVEKAPEKLLDNPSQITTELINFTITNVNPLLRGVVCTQFDKLTSTVFTSTIDHKTINFSVNKQGLVAADSLSFDSPVISRTFHKKYGYVHLEIGMLDPSEIPTGTLKMGNKTLLKKLHRPVDMVVSDVNEDGTDDFIIANFGNLTGNLSWYDGKTLEQHILSQEPGARVVQVVDFDRDGKKDIIALMTQGRESIVFFKNTGKGKYKVATLLTFPPVYGSSYVEVVDFDKDGNYDMIYTNGDNADYSIVKKPYHGVRVFLNDGKNNFSLRYFYPINGASKVVVADFDKDGDFDMATISYFPDTAKNEGFLYFEQHKNFQFFVKSRKNVSNEKWLTLDYGDFDGNGSLDLVLGTLNKNPAKQPKSGSLLVLLQNSVFPQR